MKQVHWQLPFWNYARTKQYRIDIYAEGAPVGGIKQLTGAKTPFITDEDNSDDFFAPVRGWTGMINVVDEDGTLKESGIMPIDNIDHPVRLIRVNDNKLMWQGFLSCEVHSQEYTDRPTEITIPVNSVLKAMESIKIPAEWAGLRTIGSVLDDIFIYMVENVSYIYDYYMPMNSISIVNKYIDTTILFENKEHDNEGVVINTLEGKLLKYFVETLCTYMGWTAREYGNSVYFECANNSIGYRRYYLERLTGAQQIRYRYIIDNSKVYTDVTYNLDVFDWRDVGHQLSKKNGAKSVEVVADVSAANDVVDMPLSFSGEISKKNGNLYVYEQSSIIEIYSGMQIYSFGNMNASSLMKLRCTSAVLTFAPNTVVSGYIKGMSLSYVIRHMVLAGLNGTSGSSFLYSTVGAGHNNVRYYAGAFYAKATFWRVKTSSSKTTYEPEDTTLVVDEFPNYICTYPKPEGGVYCVFFPRTYKSGEEQSFNYKLSEPILTLTGEKPMIMYSGYLNITASYKVVYFNAALEDNNSISIRHDDKIMDATWSVGATLRIGDKYWNGQAWQDTECRFRLYFQNGNIQNNWDKNTMLPPTDGLLIPATGMTRGTIEFAIWPDASYTLNNGSESPLEMFFRSIKIEHIYPNDNTVNDKSSNHYYKPITGFNSGDEISINTDIASDMNNRASQHILMNSETETMKTLMYADGKTDRPERVLLARLEDYYGSARENLTLKTGRLPNPNPLVRLENNGVRYIPLSEKIDWRADTSSIKIFETPDGNV